MNKSGVVYLWFSFKVEGLKLTTQIMVRERLRTHPGRLVDLALQPAQTSGNLRNLKVIPPVTCIAARDPDGD